MPFKHAQLQTLFKSQEFASKKPQDRLGNSLVEDIAAIQVKRQPPPVPATKITAAGKAAAPAPGPVSTNKAAKSADTDSVTKSGDSDKAAKSADSDKAAKSTDSDKTAKSVDTADAATPSDDDEESGQEKETADQEEAPKKSTRQRGKAKTALQSPAASAGVARGTSKHFVLRVFSHGFAQRACVAAPANITLHASSNDLLEILRLLHSGGSTNTELDQDLEKFRPYVISQKVAFVTDLPYFASGTDTTSGDPMTADHIEVVDHHLFIYVLLTDRAYFQALLGDVKPLFSSKSVFLAFADLEQCAAIKRAATKPGGGLRCPPSPLIWEKTNKQAFFAPVVMQPGATYVLQL